GGAWTTVEPWPPLPDRLRQSRALGGRLGWVAWIPILAAAALAPLFMSNATAVTLNAVMGFAIVGLSVGIITGLGGQLSLGQFALAGIGAAGYYWTSDATGSLVFGLLAAGVVASVVSVLIGLPALRGRGLLLAVTTLAFASAAEAWLFQQSWM